MVDRRRELQRYTVDAVAQAGGWRAITKDVTEMAAAGRAGYLGPNRAIAGVVAAQIGIVLDGVDRCSRRGYRKVRRMSAPYAPHFSVAADSLPLGPPLHRQSPRQDPLEFDFTGLSAGGRERGSSSSPVAAWLPAGPPFPNQQVIWLDFPCGSPLCRGQKGPQGAQMDHSELDTELVDLGHQLGRLRRRATQLKTAMNHGASEWSSWSSVLEEAFHIVDRIGRTSAGLAWSGHQDRCGRLVPGRDRCRVRRQGPEATSCPGHGGAPARARVAA